jgi:uncharacterized protein (DUF2235 family)
MKKIVVCFDGTWNKPKRGTGAYALNRTLLGRGRYLRPIMRLEHGNESVHETVRQKIERDWKYSPKNPGL